MARVHKAKKVKRLSSYKQDEKQFLKKHPDKKDTLKKLINQLLEGEQVGKRLSKGHKIQFAKNIRAYDVHIVPEINKYILWVDYLNVDGDSVLLLIAITDHDNYQKRLKTVDYKNMKDYDVEPKTESVLVEAFEVHKELNPKIWDSNNNLLPDVRDKILEIVEEFKANVKDMTGMDINPVDVHLLGSNASYNYTDHSDLDVHLVVNFEMIDTNEDLVQALFNLQKADFNNAYDISIHGVDVELYVEDIKASTISNGIYSVTNDSWIKEPEMLTDIPEVDIEDQIDDWKETINNALDSDNIDDIANIIDELYLIRKNSLVSEGEYGEGNQLFKEIRNLGLLDDLKSKYMELKSKELSLEHYKREGKDMARIKEPYFYDDGEFNLEYLAGLLLQEDENLIKIIKNFKDTHPGFDFYTNDYDLDEFYDSIYKYYEDTANDWDFIEDGEYVSYYGGNNEEYIFPSEKLDDLADAVWDVLDKYWELF